MIEGPARHGGGVQEVVKRREPRWRWVRRMKMNPRARSLALDSELIIKNNEGLMREERRGQEWR